MKIIFWGTPEYSTKSLQSLIDSKYDVVAVVTQPDKKRLRGSNLIPSPIKKLSKLNNIPVLCPEKIKNNKDFITSLKSYNCDLFLVIAYGKILSKEILDIPKYGSWNAHASLLPRWRGAAPIQWSLLSGDKSTGVGIMKMEEGLDTGDILLEEEIRIENEENLQTLHDKLSILSSKLFLKALEIISRNKFKGNVNLTPQKNKSREIKYARMINKTDYILKFDDDASNILKKVNGLYPHAYVIYKNKNLKVIKVRILSHSEITNLNNKNKDYLLSKLKPNLIVDIIKNEGIIISTSTLPIVLLQIKLEGRNISSKNQLIEQLKPIVGENFV